MKTLLSKIKIAVFALPLVASSFATAQVGGSGSPAGVDVTLAQLFNNVKAFSAKCEMRMLESDKSEKMSVPMDFSYLEGKMRADTDMSQMKSKQIPPGAVEGMKKMGLDRVTALVLPEQKSQVIIYPTAKSYLNMPLSKQQLDALAGKAKLEKKELGKETVAGHACVKNKVTVTNDDGKTQEYTVWNATDMKDFPVQVQTIQDGNDVIITFTDVQLAKPDASKFDMPKDFTKYDDMGSFMQAMMARMMSGQ